VTKGRNVHKSFDVRYYNAESCDYFVVTGSLQAVCENATSAQRPKYYVGNVSLLTLVYGRWEEGEQASRTCGFMDFSPLCQFTPWTFRPQDVEEAEDYLLRQSNRSFQHCSIGHQITV